MEAPSVASVPTASTCVSLWKFCPQTPMIDLFCLSTQKDAIAWEFIFIQSCAPPVTGGYGGLNILCPVALPGVIHILSLSQDLLGRFAKFSK